MFFSGTSEVPTTPKAGVEKGALSGKKKHLHINNWSNEHELHVSRQEQEQELSEPDQDMEETLEGDQGEEAAVGYERSI